MTEFSATEAAHALAELLDTVVHRGERINHGRNVPMPVKRGVADAGRRLYNERAALRYDGLSLQMRMADVVEQTKES